MKRAWTQPLRHQLFYALVLLFVPMALAAGGLGWDEYRETVDELTADTQATVLRSVAAIERELTGLDRMARGLLNNPAVQALDPTAVEPLLRPQRLQRPSLLEIALVNQSGELIAHGTGEES